MSVLTSTEIKRVFEFKRNGETINLIDIDPLMPYGEVVKFYASQYPELTTAKITGPEWKDDVMVFKINTTVGTLG